MKNRKNRWKFLLVVFVVAWSLWEIYPPTSRSLITEFREQADPAKVDAAFNKIVETADALTMANPDPHRQFGNLMTAIGTNDIRPYFPYLELSGEEHPTYAILNLLQRKAAGKIKLGLDLQGGTEFLVRLDTSHIQSADTNAAKVSSTERERLVSQAAEVLRHRVDRLGVAEPVIQPAGQDHIMIQLPGLSQANQDEARQNIQKAAYLEFRLVHPESAQLIKDGIIEPGYEVLKMKRRAPDGTIAMDSYLVQKKLAGGLTGKYVKRAFPSRNPVSNEPVIELQFDSEGAEKFFDVTSQHVGEQLAIVLDGELYTAPRINGPIRGNCEISGGNMDINEAITIANVLENPLETPVKIDEMREVDPTLGKDTIKSGISSAAYGTIAVAGFMIAYYLFAGFVADIALMTNIIILLGVMCSIGTTLTLPGIAGVVLTVGMAVDANVLIFERIREESGKGKPLRVALAAGYDRAFRTIFDSHVTTLISSIILIYMGTGPIKGFGITLTIGVAASLFTALVVTRLVFDFLLAKGLLKSLPMLHVIRVTNLDFMKFSKVAFVISSGVIIAGLAYGTLGRGKSMMGIDFAGGDNLMLRFSQKIEPDKLREAVSKLGIPDAQIQYQKDLSRDSETLRITSPYGTGGTISSNLTKLFPNAQFEELGVEKVGPTIGGDIMRSAIMASMLSMLGILIYVAIRYEFSFAIGAIVAVVHDILLTIGCYCMTGLFGEGRQFNATMVAAVLTIIGFSLNDKVVIFDRIREDLKLGANGSFKDLINQALNQTLSRTIITSGTVFLATMSLFIFGGGAINDFAFTFLVGIITGTYSSIYIASAFVLWWHKGERPTAAPQTAMSATVATRA
jgi:SecD/SecF fusion protein